MRKVIIFLLFLVPLIALNSCMRDHSVVDPVETVDYRQFGMIINKSFYHPWGIDTLFINELDSLELDVSTILLIPPDYTWTSNDENVLKITPNSTVDSMALAIAVGDSGVVTSFTISDQEMMCPKLFQLS